MLTILQATDNAGADFTLDNPNSGSDEGSFTFESDAQAFEAGADNMDEFGAWGKNGFANSFTDAQSTYENISIGATDPDVEALVPTAYINGFTRADLAD